MATLNTGQERAPVCPHQQYYFYLASLHMDFTSFSGLTIARLKSIDSIGAFTSIQVQPKV